MNDDRTPSLAPQPPTKTREQHIQMIELFISQGNEQIARQYDDKVGTQYFKEKESGSAFYLDSFITKHPAMLDLKKRVAKLATINDPVIISGPTGTGKELIAHALHGNKSPDKFIDLNCAGMPEYLIESELFGHIKGAFTGADKDKLGLIRAAEGGTLFLDEIGELPIMLQAKLLRVLQDKRIRPVGSEKFFKVNFRLVAATHRNIPNMITEGKFRKDLYERLSTFELHTLALKDRPDDIALILLTLDKTFPLDKITITHLLTNGILDGNVRALERIVRRYQVFQELP